MALIVRKKSGIVFSPPSYISGNSKKENKIEKIIEETIIEKIFNTLDISRKIYFKLIEYYVTYTLADNSGEKIISSFNLRLKKKADKKFTIIPANEIQFCGITLIEFENFLIDNNATIYANTADILDKI